MSVDTGLAGRTVVITGGGAGIGAESARRFAAQGARVIVLERDPGHAAAIAAELPAAEVHEIDVTDDRVVDALFADLAASGRSVDVLMNNVAANTSDSFLAIERDAIDRDIHVSLALPMRMTQRVLPGMIAAGGGVIVNISSVNGLEYYGNESYSAGKAGLISFTKSIAAAYGRHGIRSNAIAPGSIHTRAWDRRKEIDPDIIARVSRWYPLGRMGLASDIADAAVFLASDQARWISGVCLPVDGGLLAGKPLMAEDILADQLR